MCISFKYTIGAHSEAGLDQVLYYDGLGWADERKTLAEDEGGNTNPDNYNDAGAGSSDDETSVGNLVTIKGDFVSDAAEVSCAFIHLNRSLTSLLPLSFSFFPLFSSRGRGCQTVKY